MKYKYNGSDVRVFPTLGITVKPGDEFEAPENFDVPNVVPTGAKKSTPATSAASDPTVGE